MILNNAQDAIQEAITGGWERRAFHEKYYFVDEMATKLGIEDNVPAILTDPLFWQALGKARGWESILDNRQDDEWSKKIYAWRGYAIKWFETRLSNGDENKFWQSLP